jgi:uncharacterized protein (DUF433 family)
MKDLASYISIDPDIRFGKPCIIGTRISVSDILQWLASGMSHEEIQKDFPLLKEEHIKSALSFTEKRESITKTIAASL